MMSERMDRLTVFITSPLEDEYVERIRAVAPDRVDVLYDPDLMPPTRYIGDHNGPPDFELTAEQRAQWLGYLQRADILFDFPQVLPGGSGVLEMSPHLKWVQTTSAGVGQYVVRLGLQDSDLIITTASGVHAGPLSEYVFMVLLNYFKFHSHIQREQRKHHWERYCSDELAGKTLAIVGPGRVGGRIAAIGQVFGMRVIAIARDSNPERAAELGLDELYPSDRLHAILSVADAVVLCVPHTPETENLIDREAFESMKDGVVFINIARGQVVEEAAMLAAMESGKIGFAALDVFRSEPLARDSPFWDLPDVLISPHSASTGYGENSRITDIMCHNLRCFVDGRTGAMWNILDKQRMY